MTISKIELRRRSSSQIFTLLTLFAVVVSLLLPQSAPAYIDVIPSLGRLIADAHAIVVLQVDKVDREKRIIVFRTTEILANADDVTIPDKIRHQIGAGLHPREPKQILDWAKPGKVAVCLIAGNVAITCIGNEWYETSRIDPATWTMTRGRSELAFAYYGSPELLQGHLVAILAGKEVTITAVRWGVGAAPAQAIAFKQSLRGRDLPLWRIRASLKMPREVGDLVESPRWIVGAGIGDADDLPALLADLESAAAHRRAAAAETLGLIGRPAKPALPALVAGMQDSEEWVAIKAVAAALQIDPRHADGLATLQKMMTSDDPEIRRAAIATGGDLGRQASVVVDQLVAAVNDPHADVRWAAVESLGQCCDAANIAVPALLKTLSNRELLAPTIDALGMLGTDAQAAVPGLVKLLDDSEPSIRWAAALALLRCDSRSAQRAIPLFLEALRSGNARTRWDAIWYFELLAEPQAALQELAELVDNGDPGVRASALMVLGNISDNSAPAMAAVVRALDDKSETVRVAAARAVSLMYTEDLSVANRAADVFVDVFCPTAPYPSEWSLWNAASFLQRLGEIEAIAVPRYCQLTTHSLPHVRQAALVALINLGDIPSMALPAIRQCLTDSDPAVQFKAARAMWVANSDAAAVLPTLMAVAKSGDARTREEGIKLIKQIGPQARDAIVSLWDRLSDIEARVRVAAADALWTIDRRSDKIFPTLVAGLSESDPTVRVHAAKVLGELGPAAAEAMEELRLLLRDRDRRVRIAAAASLYAIDHGVSDVLPVLVAALDDADDTVRQDACEVLGGFGLSAKVALPQLREVLSEASPELRAAAAMAILRISAERTDEPAFAALLAYLDLDLDDGEATLRIRVMQCLAELGPAAAAAVPALRTLSADADVDLSTAAREALLQISGQTPGDQSAVAASTLGGQGNAVWYWGAAAIGLVLAAALAYYFCVQRPRGSTPSTS